MQRIGLMIPSSNTVMEPDFVRAFQDAATVHSARMFLEDPVTVAGELRMLDEFAFPAARDLGTLDPDLVVFGCTSAGALRGIDADTALRTELETLASAPVLGVLDCMTLSLRSLGAHRVSLLTPYVDSLTDTVAQGLSSAGFDVRRATGLGLENNKAIGAIPPDIILQASLEAITQDSDALAVACTNFRAYEVVDEIEARSGVGVVTACSSVIDRVTSTLLDLA